MSSYVKSLSQRKELKLKRDGYYLLFSCCFDELNREFILLLFTKYNGFMLFLPLDTSARKIFATHLS